MHNFFSSLTFFYISLINYLTSVLSVSPYNIKGFTKQYPFFIAIYLQKLLSVFFNLFDFSSFITLKITSNQIWSPCSRLNKAGKFSLFQLLPLPLIYYQDTMDKNSDLRKFYSLRSTHWQHDPHKVSDLSSPYVLQPLTFCIQDILHTRQLLKYSF